MSETDQAPEAIADDEGAPEAAVAVAEPVESESDAETVAEPVAEESVAEPAAVEETPAVRAGAAPVREAKILLCERGHRTVALWSAPTNCHARPTRSGPECGRQLYPIGELPEQVQKALNPLKASKKASKG
jgi:hypothetical protein